MMNGNYEPANDLFKTSLFPALPTRGILTLGQFGFEKCCNLGKYQSAIGVVNGASEFFSLMHGKVEHSKEDNRAV